MTIGTIYRKYFDKGRFESSKKQEEQKTYRDTKLIKALIDIPVEFILLVENIDDKTLKYYKVLDKEGNKAIIVLGPYKKNQVFQLDKCISDVLLKYYGGKFFVKIL